ncbi:hypothetical protein HK101_004601, partial [Irineochytrium annulatum]
LFPWTWIRPTPPYLQGSIPEGQFKDPWARREVWRTHPFFSANNRMRHLFPGFALALTGFGVFVAYDYWYQTAGPGKAENDK